MENITDKVFLITGAASGIGAGVTRSLLERGAKHVAILDINVGEGKSLEAELNKKHGENSVKFIKCDVTTSELDSAYEETLESFQYIDAVINNAGIMDDKPQVYLKEIALNVTALITSSLKAYNLMRVDRNGKGGTIINISSMASFLLSPILPIYGATKTAVLHFSNCLGHITNYERTKVRILTICFGKTDTNLIRNPSIAIDVETEEILQQFIQSAPCQSLESAVKGLIAAFETGEPGSTWLVKSNELKPITSRINESFEILSKGLYE